MNTLRKISLGIAFVLSVLLFVTQGVYAEQVNGTPPTSGGTIINQSSPSKSTPINAKVAMVIDFEGAPTGSIAGTEYGGSGVLFSSQGGGGALEYDYAGNITEIITSDNWFNPMTIKFVNPSNNSENWVVTSVSMENHHAGDYWIVTAYDINGNLLATQYVNYEAKWITFSGVGSIHSLIIDASTTAFAMDNLTFDGLSVPYIDASLTISPPSGRYVRTQNFDMTLILESTSLSGTVSSVMWNGSNVTSSFNSCSSLGTLTSGGQTFRCAISGSLLGVGSHNIRVGVTLSDGSMVTDSVNWRVFGNTEP